MTPVAITIIGWMGVVAAGVVMLFGLSALLGELTFLARWKWGNAHQLKRAARLGWNTGAPPDGATFLALEQLDGAAQIRGDLRRQGFAVMVRRGDQCHSVNGGMDMPVKNVTGWLEIVEEEHP